MGRNRYRYVSSKRPEIFEIKRTNKVSDEMPHDFKCIGNGTQNQKKSIEKNPDSDLIEENLYRMEILWLNVIGFLIMHVGALYGIYLCFFKAKFLTFVYAFFLTYSTAMAITMGAHRLYSHRSFKANIYIRFILMVFQTMTSQKGIKTWVRDHRTHHKYTDTNADPHNSKRGFFFSHIGWLMVRRHPDVIRKGKTIDMSDVEQDPVVKFQTNHYLKIFFVASVILPPIIPCSWWNETVWNSFFISVVGRIAVLWNLTWLINSAAHMYGSKPYTKDITPVENSVLSLFTLGEGMHNYHHTFPWDYRASEYNNLTTIVIDYCFNRGWVYDLKTAPRELLKQQTMKKGDGSHPVYNTLNPK